jgi:uncharacterized protein (UPF0548 family)
MFLLMFLLSKPSKETIELFVSDLASSHFSYPDVGASVYGAPKGYNVDHNRIRLGTGEDAWKRGVEGIKRWEMFNLGWTESCWPEAPIRWGTNVAVLIRHLGFHSLNGSRIVYVVDDQGEDMQRYGFAYGTLTEHAEAGEEIFTVEWHRKSDDVYYDLFAFSKPAHLLSRMGYPVVRALQRRFARDSMASMARWCGQ